MSLIYVVLPAALLLAAVAVAAFIWAVRSGQMDDLETPALRVLHDDEPVAEPTGRREEDPGDETAPTFE
jgi:cbb3-type cytochrome oxidase maturation protein